MESSKTDGNLKRWVLKIENFVKNVLAVCNQFIYVQKYQRFDEDFGRALKTS
jgi:hypothetical protein